MIWVVVALGVLLAILPEGVLHWLITLLKGRPEDPMADKIREDQKAAKDAAEQIRREIQNASKQETIDGFNAEFPMPDRLGTTGRNDRPGETEP